MEIVKARFGLVSEVEKEIKDMEAESALDALLT